MKPFEYGDEEIGSRELTFAVSSVIIGTGALSMPRVIAEQTLFSDGWIILLIGGVICAFFAWCIAKIANTFTEQTFFQYTSIYLSKPIAYLVTSVMVLTFASITAYQARAISVISQTYLFSKTPIELLSFFYLLVVVYGVSGSRVALLRLNMLFLPIVVCAIFSLSLLNINLMEPDNVLPLFQTKWNQYIVGMKESIFTFIGFEIVLFYSSIVKQKDKAPLAAAKGVMITNLLYILIYLTCIMVFSYSTTKSLAYPVIELGKEIEIGGGFLERFDAIFFTTWIITIFNTTAMYYDIAVIGFCSMFPAIKKKTFIFISAPIIYLLNMLPENVTKLTQYSTYLAWIDMACIIIVPILVFSIYKIKGGGKSEPSS
ncbi:GerAB/ArcD/ProY family transporter [Bacillus cytotoxicus]|uniref:GerAB/ArcD/ProY family transporter n=1 Tax=Bacillus cereus group TaxID=86661 RepID=UPI000660F9F6|nr:MULTISPECIES: endospore germination permease [Bacillus cereus group]AWC31591.1 spore gernimation protein GerLB [Bacillus cytotoxicus]AWC35631.1 spore gernimation protein GerLB [Bacillus cytotoxicus]AWC59863.1 spore gernimation protein GerLB [Bacillus cytotoxicus]KMT49938.1 spore gernimation protein GerLB [Bacillus cytotoxicus]QTR71734.1 endospore germination permease [Bacillus cytotoxicus]